MIYFSLVSPTSLENVQTIWVPELKEHYPSTPYILVVMKSDLRDKFDQQAAEFRAKDMQPVPSSQGEAMKKCIGGQSYIECSALTGYNKRQVFEEAMKIVVHPPVTSQQIQIEPTAHCCIVAESNLKQIDQSSQA
jgi:Ras-related C3 botulinum toxin substrate 1